FVATLLLSFPAQALDLNRPTAPRGALPMGARLTVAGADGDGFAKAVLRYAQDPHFGAKGSAFAVASPLPDYGTELKLGTPIWAKGAYQEFEGQYTAAGKVDVVSQSEIIVITRTRRYEGNDGKWHTKEYTESCLEKWFHYEGWSSMHGPSGEELSGRVFSGDAGSYVVCEDGYRTSASAAKAVGVIVASEFAAAGTELALREILALQFVKSWRPRYVQDHYPTYDHASAGALNSGQYERATASALEQMLPRPYDYKAMYNAALAAIATRNYGEAQRLLDATWRLTASPERERTTAGNMANHQEALDAYEQAFGPAPKPKELEALATLLIRADAVLATSPPGGEEVLLTVVTGSPQEVVDLRCLPDRKESPCYQLPVGLRVYRDVEQDNLVHISAPDGRIVGWVPSRNL
ncbi:MAG: hypothetical protein ACI9VR_001685, partial [Cognaticolwellia sp.]